MTAARSKELSIQGIAQRARSWLTADICTAFEQAGFHFPRDNDDIRGEVVRRLNESAGYRQAFARSFPHVRAGTPITFDDFARAISEFEFTLVFADAPIDRYARGVSNALTPMEKRGAVLFFGRAGCVQCHAVSGPGPTAVRACW